MKLKNFKRRKRLCSILRKAAIHIIRINLHHIKRHPAGIKEKYTTDILRRVGLENCKPVSTPISTSEKLVVESGEALGPRMQ